MTEFLEQGPLKQFCKKISQHGQGGAVHHINMFALSMVSDETMMNVNMVGVLGAQ